MPQPTIPVHIPAPGEEPAEARPPAYQPYRVAAALGLGILVLLAYRTMGSSPVPVVTPTLVALEQGKIFVHVDGAVARPGVYELKPGSRVVDAVDAAGGLSGEADPLQVNLAERLEDGVKIIVPRKGQSTPTASSTPDVPAGSDPVEPDEPGSGHEEPPLEEPPPPIEPAPPVEGPASPEPVVPTPRPSTSVAAPVPPPAPAETPKPAPPPSIPAASKISLNRGSFEQFASIPGMDDALASAIIAYRKTPHAFTSIDELARVPGFTPGKLDEVRPYLRL